MLIFSKFKLSQIQYSDLKLKQICRSIYFISRSFADSIQFENHVPIGLIELLSGF